MLKHQLKIDLWSLWLAATAPSAAQGSSDAQAYSGKRASRRGVSKAKAGCRNGQTVPPG